MPYTSVHMPWVTHISWAKLHQISHDRSFVAMPLLADLVQLLKTVYSTLLSGNETLETRGPFHSTKLFRSSLEKYGKLSHTPPTRTRNGEVSRASLTPRIEFKYTQKRGSCVCWVFSTVVSAQLLQYAVRPRDRSPRCKTEKVFRRHLY